MYRTIILPLVLYGCETCALTVREELRLRVFENRVLRMIFGPKRDEVTGVLKKQHNEEFNDLYSSPKIVRVIKSRRMRWAAHVARIGKGVACAGFWWENLRKRGLSENPSGDGRIILRCIFKKWDWARRLQ